MKVTYIFYILIVLLIIISLGRKMNEKFISLRYTNSNESGTTVEKCLTSLNNIIDEVSKDGRCHNLTNSPNTKGCVSQSDMGESGSLKYQIGSAMLSGKYLNSFNTKDSSGNETYQAEVGLVDNNEAPGGGFRVHYDERSDILLNSFPEQDEATINARLEELKIPVLVPKLKCNGGGDVETCANDKLELDSPVEVDLYYHDKPFSKFTLGLNDPNTDTELANNYCNPNFIKCNCEDKSSTTCNKEICDFNVAVKPE